MNGIRLIIFCSFLISGPVFAHAFDLQPGLYEVEVKVELPHLTKASHVLKKKICLTKKNLSENKAFHILSNNPLSKCENLSICGSSGKIKFQVVCPGRNAAYAFGVFTLQFTSFSGTIKMNMGGKT